MRQKCRGLRFVAFAAPLLLLPVTSSARAQSGAGQPCGGPNDLKCSEGFICEAPNAKCADNNPAGTCIVKREVCTTMYQPVCGCDGKTYGNDCERVSKAARKDHDGECKPAQ